MVSNATATARRNPQASHNRQVVCACRYNGGIQPRTLGRQCSPKKPSFTLSKRRFFWLEILAWHILQQRYPGQVSIKATTTEWIGFEGEQRGISAHWGVLLTYLTDGRIEIDNNATERDIKPFVIARKNFLFACTPQGADSLGVHFSLVLTARLHGLEPMAYYTEPIGQF